MDRVPIHGRGDPTSRVQQTQHLSSALYTRLSFVCQMEIHIIPVLDFLYSLSSFFSPAPPSMDRDYPPVDFSPRDRSQHLQVFKSPQAFISSLSVAPHPLFPCYWPTPPVDFSPYSWIFLHIHE